MIAVVLVSASRNGFANSQLAPIPLNSNSGGSLAAAVPDGNLEQLPVDRDLPRLDLAAASRPGSLLAGSSLKDVGPRSCGKDGMAFAAERRGRRNLFA